MRVLVTGGAGFIGSHFAKRLAASGNEVVVLDKLTYSGNPANLADVGCPVIEGDICDTDTVMSAAKGCDAIVNFAAETHVDRSILDAEEFVETNVLGAHVVAESANRLGIKLVHVSTDEVYGDVIAPHRSAEGDMLHPSSPYSASKAGGDLQVLAAVRTFGVDACITRGANTYGPNQYPEKLIPLMVDERFRRPSPPGLRRRPPDPRLAPCLRPLRGGRARAARRRLGRGLQRRAAKTTRT